VCSSDLDPPSGPLLVVTVERWSGWASTS